MLFCNEFPSKVVSASTPLHGWLAIGIIVQMLIEHGMPKRIRVLHSDKARTVQDSSSTQNR